jgi:hypothetical protein
MYVNADHGRLEYACPFSMHAGAAMCKPRSCAHDVWHARIHCASLDVLLRAPRPLLADDLQVITRGSTERRTVVREACVNLGSPCLRNAVLASCFRIRCDGSTDVLAH